MTRQSTPPGDPVRTDVERRSWCRVVSDAKVVIGDAEAGSYAAEQYRNLAFQIEQAARAGEGGSLVVAVTSPDPGAGKTLTSLNLALTLAREGDRRVLLVEGDLWKPTLRSYLEIEADTPGFAQILEESAPLDGSVVTVWGTGLDVLISGERGRTTGLMAQRRISRVVDEIRRRYELVVIDTPPIMLASGRSLAACADRALVVVRSGKTKRRDIEEALSVLGPDKVLGFVLNAGRQTSDKGYGYYGYGYPRTRGIGGAQSARGRSRWRIAAAVLLAAAGVGFGYWYWTGSGASDEAAPTGLAAERAVAAPAVEPASRELPRPRPASGVEDLAAELVFGARQAAAAVQSYDAMYEDLDFPGGDPGADRGTAADLVVRAFRSVGIDLQQEVHDDMLAAPEAYGTGEPDTSVDHRRVRNLRTYFERHALSLEPALEGGWMPGDVVVWATAEAARPDHIGVVSDRRGASGDLEVIHHHELADGGLAGEEDVLGRWQIVGHYRWPDGEEG